MNTAQPRGGYGFGAARFRIVGTPSRYWTRLCGGRRIEGRHASEAQAELYEPQLGLRGLAP